MDQQEIIENNLLIHAFMGGDISKETFSWRPGSYSPMTKENLGYNSAWGWLMLVVEKVESIEDNFHGHFAVHISSNNCTIQGTNLRTGPHHFHPAYFSDHYGETKIEATWLACIAFINFYNQGCPRP